MLIVEVELWLLCMARRGSVELTDRVRRRLHDAYRPYAIAVIEQMLEKDPEREVLAAVLYELAFHRFWTYWRFDDRSLSPRPLHFFLHLDQVSTLNLARFALAGERLAVLAEALEMTVDELREIARNRPSQLRDRLDRIGQLARGGALPMPAGTRGWDTLVERLAGRLAGNRAAVIDALCLRPDGEPPDADVAAELRLPVPSVKELRKQAYGQLTEAVADALDLFVFEPDEFPHHVKCLAVSKALGVSPEVARARVDYGLSVIHQAHEESIRVSAATR